MKREFTVLAISAITDFILNTGSSLTAAMLATGIVSMPSKPVVIVALLFGVMQAARTVQQALKMTPETVAALRGDPAVTVTASKTP